MKATTTIGINALYWALVIFLLTRNPDRILWWFGGIAAAAVLCQVGWYFFTHDFNPAAIPSDAFSCVGIM